MDQGYVTSNVRSRLQLLVTDLSDDDVVICTTAGLKDWNRHNPIDLYGTFAAITNVNEYPFASLGVTGVDSLQQVLYTPGSLLFDSIGFDAQLQQVIDADFLRDSFGGNIYDNPSLVKIFFQKLAQFREQFEVSFEVLKTPTGSVFRMSRCPMFDGTGYWRGNGRWNLDMIDEDSVDSEKFIVAVFSHCCEARANKLAVMKQYSEGSGVSMSPSFDYWNTKAIEYGKRFAQSFGASAGIMQIG